MSNSTRFKRNGRIYAARAPLTLAALLWPFALAVGLNHPAAAQSSGFPTTERSGERIVWGEPVSIRDWPSFALVRYYGANSLATCGGTFIAPDWVLTAAHCVAGRSGGSFRVTEEMDDLDVGGRELPVDRAVVHDRYRNLKEPHYDVALLHLATRTRVRPQSLASTALMRDVSPGAAVRVAGFGLTMAQPLDGPRVGGASRRLQATGLSLVAQDECRSKLEAALGRSVDDVVDAAAVCAGDTISGKRDSCSGDSGGPLVMMRGGAQVQVGVVSWGPGCGQPNTVGVYTSVAHFESWIKRHAPDAVFVTVSPPSPVPVPAPFVPAPQPSTEQPCGLPARAVASDVSVSLVEGPVIRVGDAVHVRAVAAASGQLVVINVDTTTCRAYQVYPNSFSDAAGRARVVGAGAVVVVPDAGDTFAIRVQEPVGPNRLYAMIVPPGAPIEDIVGRGLNMRNFEAGGKVLRDLGERVSSSTPSRFGEFRYEIRP